MVKQTTRQLADEVKTITRKLADGRISKGINVRQAKLRLRRIRDELNRRSVSSPREAKVKELAKVAVKATVSPRFKPQNIKQAKRRLRELERELGERVVTPRRSQFGNLGKKVQRRKESKKIRTEFAKEQITRQLEPILNKTQQNRLNLLLSKAKTDRERIKIINNLNRVLPKSGELSPQQRREFENIFAGEVSKKRNEIISKRGRDLLSKPQNISTSSVYFNKLSQPRFFRALDTAVKRTERKKIDSRFLPIIDVYSRANTGTQRIIERIIKGNKGGTLGRGFAEILASPFGTAQLINTLNEDNLRALGIISKSGLGKDYFDFIKKVIRRRTKTARAVLSETIRDPWTYAFVLLGLAPVIGLRTLGKIGKFSAKPEVRVLTSPQKKIRAGQKIQPNRLVLDKQTNKVYVSGADGIARLAGRLKDMPLRTQRQLQTAVNETFKALDNQNAIKRIKADAKKGDKSAQILADKIEAKKAVDKADKLFNKITDDLIKENQQLKRVKTQYKNQLRKVDAKLSKQADSLFNRMTNQVIRENKQIKIQNSKLRRVIRKKITPQVKKQLTAIKNAYVQRVRFLEKRIKTLKKQLQSLIKSFKSKIGTGFNNFTKPLRSAIKKLENLLLQYKNKVKLIEARLSDKKAVRVAKKELKKASKRTKKQVKLDATTKAKRQGFSGVREQKAYNDAFSNIKKREKAGLKPLKRDLTVLNRIERRLNRRKAKKLKKDAKLTAKLQKQKAKERQKEIKKLLSEVKTVGVSLGKRRKLRKAKFTAKNIRDVEKERKLFLAREKRIMREEKLASKKRQQISKLNKLEEDLNEAIDSAIAFKDVASATQKTKLSNLISQYKAQIRRIKVEKALINSKSERKALRKQILNQIEKQENMSAFAKGTQLQSLKPSQRVKKAKRTEKRKLSQSRQRKAKRKEIRQKFGLKSQKITRKVKIKPQPKKKSDQNLPKALKGKKIVFDLFNEKKKKRVIIDSKGNKYELKAVDKKVSGGQGLVSVQRQFVLTKTIKAKPKTVVKQKTKPKITPKNKQKVVQKAKAVSLNKSKVRKLSKATPKQAQKYAQKLKKVLRLAPLLSSALQAKLQSDLALVQSLLPVLKTSQAQDVRIITLTDGAVKQTPKIKQTPKVVQVSASKVNQVLNIKPVLSIKTKKKPKPVLSIKTKKKPKPLPKLPKRKQSLKPNTPTNVYVKRGGKLVKFNPKPLKFKDAKRVLRWVLNNHISASGIIKRTRGKTLSLSKRINAPSRYFRKPKKGSKLPSLSLVEKRFFRLNTKTEQKQIKLAKLRKQAFSKKKKTKRRTKKRKKRR